MFDFKAVKFGMKISMKTRKKNSTPGTLPGKADGMVCRNPYFLPKVGTSKCVLLLDVRVSLHEVVLKHYFANSA